MSTSKFSQSKTSVLHVNMFLIIWALCTFCWMESMNIVWAGLAPNENHLLSAADPLHSLGHLGTNCEMGTETVLFPLSTCCSISSPTKNHTSTRLDYLSWNQPRCTSSAEKTTLPIAAPGEAGSPWVSKTSFRSKTSKETCASTLKQEVFHSNTTQKHLKILEHGAKRFQTKQLPALAMIFAFFFVSSVMVGCSSWSIWAGCKRITASCFVMRPLGQLSWFFLLVEKFLYMFSF